MSQKNEEEKKREVFQIGAKHLRVEGNEEEGYIVLWDRKIIKHSWSLEHALDIAMAVLFGDYEALWEWGIPPEAIP